MCDGCKLVTQHSHICTTPPIPPNTGTPTQIRDERRKRVVGDLGLGVGDSRQQRRLARVGAPDETHVRHEFQLKVQPAPEALLRGGGLLYIVFGICVLMLNVGGMQTARNTHVSSQTQLPTTHPPTHLPHALRPPQTRIPRPPVPALGYHQPLPVLLKLPHEPPRRLLVPPVVEHRAGGHLLFFSVL